MAKYFYYFATEQESQNWTPPQNQPWVAYCDELMAVGYSDNYNPSGGDDVIKGGAPEQPVR